MAIGPLAGFKRLLSAALFVLHTRITSVCARDGAGGALLRRALVGRLRHRGNPSRADDRRRGGAESLDPGSGVIALLLLIVAFSYRQTIFAYPTGGGAYLVAKDNIGDTPALVAAAALLIDYTLTVAVSIAAGVAALTSAFPTLHVSRVELCSGSWSSWRSATCAASASRPHFLASRRISSSAACSAAGCRRMALRHGDDRPARPASRRRAPSGRSACSRF